MKIDLCKLFGVEEGEEFKFDGYVDIYFIKNGYLYFIDIDSTERVCYLQINDVVGKNIIKLPKKKQFSQDTLNLFKCIDKEWEWIAKDFDGDIFIYDKKPNKDRNSWYGKGVTGLYINNYINQSLFDQIHWEDEEPIYTHDYVER